MVREVKSQHAAALRNEDGFDELAARLGDGRRLPPIRTVDAMAHASPVHKEAAQRVVRAPGQSIGGTRSCDTRRVRATGCELADRVAEDSLASGVVVHVQLHKLVQLLNNRRCPQLDCLGHMQISKRPNMVGLVWNTETRCTACSHVAPFVTLSNDVVLVPRDVTRLRVNHRRREQRQKARAEEGKLPAAHVVGDHLRQPRAESATYHADNMSLQAAMTLNGIGISKALRVYALLGWACPSRESAERMHRLVLRDGHDLALAAMKRHVDDAVARGDDVELSVDGAWSTRREANQSNLIVLHERKPVHVVTIDREIVGFSKGGAGKRHVTRRAGNYPHIGSSSMMEATAWQRLTAELDAVNPGFRRLVTSVCVDRDGRNTETILVPSVAHCLLPPAAHSPPPRRPS